MKSKIETLENKSIERTGIMVMDHIVIRDVTANVELINKRGILSTNTQVSKG